MTTTSGTLIEATGSEPSIKPRLKGILQCPECDMQVNLIQTHEAIICSECGLELDGLSEKDYIHKKHSSAYNFNHHFSERIAQWTATGPVVKQTFLIDRIKHHMEDLEKTFGDKYHWGQYTFTKIFKFLDKKYYTKFASKKYSERWIYLKNVIGIETPPYPNNDLIYKLRERYRQVYTAFDYLKHSKKIDGLVRNRKNIININFIFLNMLKQEDKLFEFGRYFSNVKGDMKTLRRYWLAIVVVIKKIFKRKNYKWNYDVVNVNEINKLKVYF